MSMQFVMAFLGSWDIFLRLTNALRLLTSVQQQHMHSKLAWQTKLKASLSLGLMSSILLCFLENQFKSSNKRPLLLINNTPLQQPLQLTLHSVNSHETSDLVYRKMVHCCFTTKAVLFHIAEPIWFAFIVAIRSVSFGATTCNKAQWLQDSCLFQLWGLGHLV